MAESNAGAAVTQQANRKFVISRVFDAPRELVFAAWTVPEQMLCAGGAQPFTQNVWQMDAPGGAYRIVMQAPHGTPGFADGGYPITACFARLCGPSGWS